MKLPRRGGGCAAAHLPERRAGYGAAPPASRLLRIADATALRAGLDPGDLCGPAGRMHGQAQACPRRTRGAPARPAPEIMIGKSLQRKSLRFQGIDRWLTH